MLTVTAFGRFCRKLRIDHGQVLRDMALVLGVKSSFLSSVELGKKKIPGTWEEKIVNAYNLDRESIMELREAIASSVIQVKIDLKGSNDKDRDLALTFARRFKSLDDDEREIIKNLLK